MNENENENENKSKSEAFEAVLGWMHEAVSHEAAAAAREPSAEIRQAAAQIFDLYNGFRHAGFTQAEALRLVAYIARPPSE